MPLGFHVSKTITTRCGSKKTRKMAVALIEDMRLLANYGFKVPCAQIFVSGPQSFLETLDANDKAEVRRIVDETDMILVIHGSYLDHPWKRYEMSIHNIKREMQTAAAIDATGVIVHLGAGALSNETLTYVFDKLGDTTDSVRDNVILWLEINVAKPSKFTFETPAKIIDLFDRLKGIDTHGIKVGLCIDTAHLFSCGQPLITYDETKEWFDETMSGLIDVPIMIHLNDSDSTLGSGKDKHAGLTLGNLWGNYNVELGALPIESSGLAYILNWADENNIVTILERDSPLLSHDLKLVNKLGYFQN